MGFHETSRRFALNIPRIRRFYEYAHGLGQSVATLRQANAELQDNLARVSEAERSARARATELGAQLGSSRAELLERSAAAERLREELTRCRAEIEHSREEAHLHKAEWEKLSQQANAAEKDREELELQLYVLRADYQQAVRLSDQTRLELNSDREELVTLKALAADARRSEARLAEAERDLQATKRMNDNLSVQVKEASARLEHLQTELHASSAARDLAFSEKTKLEARLAESQTRWELIRHDLQNRGAGEIAEQALQSEHLMQALRQAGITETATRTDVEQYYARMAGQLSIIGADFSALRRSLHTKGVKPSEVNRLRSLYLDLLENALTGSVYGDQPMDPWSGGKFDPEVRRIGRDWPSGAQTMIGTARMRNLRSLTESVLGDDVPGDFLEAGVWRGGACIYARGIFAAYNNSGRKVWVADSFAGLPKPDADKYPADAGDRHHTMPELAISLDEVKGNFAKYDLLDEQVVFVPGWFKDTLPGLPVEKLSVLRLDGDMYSSTMETLEALYYRVQPGGYVIIDDYILLPCREAVDDFRRKLNIFEPLQHVDGAAVFWRKER
jgi:O-methyltransferase